MNKNKLLSVILVLIVYMVSAGASYLLFSESSFSAKSAKTSLPTTVTSGKMAFDETLPKTEPCPLNGALYSKQQKDWWEKHRPLGIMIENHQDSRPQSGLSSADVLYEAVAEGGITRFLSIFYCDSAAEVVLVRRARQ